jgi:ABC-type phosphate transport system substrate-binding protein
MKKMNRACTVAAVLGGAVLTTAGPALAGTTDCTALNNVVYVAGSSASQPYLQALANALGTSISIIYAAPTSCQGLADVTTQVQQAGSGFSYLDPTTGAAVGCTASGGAPYPAINVDIGVSDVYPSSCIVPVIALGDGGAAGIQQDFHGPIQPMEIVVPYASSAFSISADAAYTVFGWGGQMYPVNPWTVPTAVWVRNDTSGTQVMVGAAIGLSAAKWLSDFSAEAGAAQSAGGSGAMATDVINSGATQPNATIGILSAGTADPKRGAAGTNDAGVVTGLKPLAFQATNQDCGYYPDSQLSTFDKINVRQGRYAIWGPLHFVVNVDGSGNPLATTATPANPVASSNASVAALIGAITHTTLSTTSTPTLKQAIAAETNSHFVPDCAMQVSRSAEVSTGSSGEASYQPTGACGCYFESLTGGGTTTSSYCQTCSSDTDCADAGVYQKCNYGYCEAK